jgi:hypothetical protein
VDNGNVFQTCVGESERYQTAWRMILTSDANEYLYVSPRADRENINS